MLIASNCITSTHHFHEINQLHSALSEKEEAIQQFKNKSNSEIGDCIKSTARLILDNFKWFNASSSLSKTTSFEQDDLILGDLHRLRDSISVVNHPFTTKLLGLINTILKPKSLLAIPLLAIPKELEMRVLEHLPFSKTEQIQSIKTLKTSFEKKAITIINLARLINHHKIPLAKLALEDAQLQELQPHLTYVNLRGYRWTESKIHDFINSCPNLTSLDVSGCACLQNLPELPHLTALACSGCSRLKEIPKELPLLKELDCSYCRCLTAIPNALPLLTVLNCSVCHNLTAIPKALPLLIELNCSRCSSLTAIPHELPLLTTLNCSLCTALTAIPNELPLLTQLKCQDCPILTTLPHKLPLLAGLNCSDCPRLIAIPEELPLLTDLNCSICPRLTALPKELPLLTRLNCSACVSLMTISNELPLIEQLDCSWCPYLTELPYELPLVTHLYCSNCPHLRALPKIPSLAKIDSSDRVWEQNPVFKNSGGRYSMLQTYQ